MDSFLSGKLSNSNDFKNFTVRNPTKYEIDPNDKSIVKLFINYRWLSVSISTAPNFLNADNNDLIKGTTTTTAFALNLNFTHWAQTFSYARIKGFYLDNTADFIPNWRKGIDPYIQFPDLVYTGFAGQTAYTFNKKFSFNALSAQTERQLKSAGTFRPSVSYNYDIVDNKILLTGQDSSQKSKTLQLLLSAGYYHTFVINKNFYFSAGLNPGIGIISTKFYNRQPQETIITRYLNILYHTEATIALGYNSERFFVGGQLTGATSSYDQHNISTSITTQGLTYQVFAGYRFGAPKFLKKVL
ncbi:MAG: DUF4421 family protein, partial [Chitinophagaceae bacterium]